MLSATPIIGIKDLTPIATPLDRRDPYSDFTIYFTHTPEPSNTLPSSLFPSITPSSTTSTTTSSKSTSRSSTTTYASPTSTSAGERLDVPLLFQQLVTFAPGVLKPWIALTAFALLWPPGVDAKSIQLNTPCEGSLSISIVAVTVTTTVNALHTIACTNPSVLDQVSPADGTLNRNLKSDLLDPILSAIYFVTGAFIVWHAWRVLMVAAFPVLGEFKYDLESGMAHTNESIGIPAIVDAVAVGGGAGMIDWNAPTSTVRSMMTIYERTTGLEMPITPATSTTTPATISPISTGTSTNLTFMDSLSMIEVRTGIIEGVVSLVVCMLLLIYCALYVDRETSGVFQTPYGAALAIRGIPKQYLTMSAC